MKRALLGLALLAACDSGTSAPDFDVSLPAAACPPPTVLVDTINGHPVGDGTPAGCTEAAFDAALAMGGVVYFNCGPDPFTLAITKERTITLNTVVDGGGKVTLDGGNAHRIFSIDADPMAIEPVLTVQRITLAHGAGPV